MRVTVVIPCYNAQKWIAQAIESALKQDYAPLDVVVVDDGSTDSSLEIAKGFGSRVTCVAQSNKGPSAARNLGLAWASGDLIQFLDADDVLHVNRISTMVRKFQLLPGTAFVAAGFATLEGNESSAEFAENEPDFAEGSIRSEPFAVPYLPWAGLFRKGFLISIGPWDETLTRWVDLEYHARISRNCDRFVYVEAKLYGYRQHDGPRISQHNKSYTRLDDALRSLLAAEAVLSVGDRLTAAQKARFVPLYIHLARGFAHAGDAKSFCALLSKACLLSDRPQFHRKARIAIAFARAFGVGALARLLDSVLPTSR